MTCPAASPRRGDCIGWAVADPVEPLPVLDALHSTPARRYRP